MFYSSCQNDVHPWGLYGPLREAQIESIKCKCYFICLFCSSTHLEYSFSNPSKNSIFKKKTSLSGRVLFSSFFFKVKLCYIRT